MQNIATQLSPTEDRSSALAVASGSPPKPCDLPCPQCGSTDILRRYHAKGSTWSVDSIEEHNRYATEHMWTRTATEEHLTHHCRCCQHDWQTLTLRSAMLAELLANNRDEPRSPGKPLSPER